MSPRDPVTLTKAQYMQTAAGKRDKNYGGYLSFLRRNRPARVAAKADPLRPYSDQEIRRDVTGQVNAQINPVLAEITRSITSRAAAGQGAIRGYTDKLASELGSYQESAGNIYGAAQRAQAAADAALAQRLSGQGGALADQLSQRFSSAGGGGGDPGVARQTGEGASGALYATGSAALADLISRGAGEQAYAAKLPGLAKLAGIQGVRDLQLGAQRDLADETGRVRQQVPGIVAELTRAAQGDELTKTVARLADETKAETAARKAAAAAAAAGRPSSALSNTLGYLVDADGNPLLDANGDAIPTQSARRQAGSAKASKSSRATAIRNRGEAVSSARKTVLALAQKALGTPIKNPNAGKFINGDGIYLDRNGKPTNDPKRAAREGAQSWEDAYRAAYAAIADDLKSRYALPEKAIRALIVERLKAAGLKPPQQPSVNLAAAAKPRGG